MDRISVGDMVRVIDINKGERTVCLILDIIEDYNGYTYWVKYEDGHLGLEYETPSVIFVKYETNVNEIQSKLTKKIEKRQHINTLECATYEIH